MKLQNTKDDIMKTQLAQNTLITQPIDEVMNRQVNEVEQLKMELAKHGVDMANDVLERGIVLPNREVRHTVAKIPPTYPLAGAYLMQNPFKKVKKVKKKKGADSPLKRRGDP